MGNAEYMGTSVRTSPSERTESQTPILKMAELGLKKKEIDAINFAFDVYDFKGEKFLTKPDVFPMYKACKDSKDQGGFHDFVEILKLYDKNADDTILEFELFKLLVN